MIEIIPAVIPKNLEIVRERFSLVRGMVKKVQMDIVDGKFAPNKTWPFNEGQFDELLKMVRGEEKFPFIDDFLLEIDMLVLHPIEYLTDFLDIGAKSFIIHIDSTDHLEECIKVVSDSDCKIGLAIKPSGNISIIESYLSEIDFVQFMGNERIGFNGVELDTTVVEKIKEFHERHSSVPIQIDIGVDLKTAPKLIKAGVTRLISGSAIFNSSDIKSAIIALQNS